MGDARRLSIVSPSPARFRRLPASVLKSHCYMCQGREDVLGLEVVLEQPGGVSRRSERLTGRDDCGARISVCVRIRS